MPLLCENIVRESMKLKFTDSENVGKKYNHWLAKKIECYLSRMFQ